MLFLLLAILSSSVLAIVLKYLSTDNTYGVYFVNYCTCALLAFLFLEPKSLWNGDFLPLGLGAVSGALYLAALIAYGYSIRKSGAVLSSVFSRLGVLVPILLSVCLFGEQPSLFQMGGLALALLAIVVINLKSGTKSQAKLPIVPLLLVCCSMAPATACRKSLLKPAAAQTTACFYSVFLLPPVCLLSFPSSAAIKGSKRRIGCLA